MTDIDTYQMALLESLVSVPYNSASQFHTYVAHNPPAPEFGVACVLQSQDVTERAEAAGAPKAALLQNGRHVAAVFPTCCTPCPSWFRWTAEPVAGW